MKFVLMLTMTFSLNLLATEATGDAVEITKADTDQLYKTLESFKINKDEIRKSLENLKASGKISNAEYLKSLDELNKMDDKKLNDISKKAVEMIKTQGAEAVKLPEKDTKK